MRLQGQIRAGFFPAPLPAIDHVLQYLKRPARGRIAILDPCCGEGLAISHLAAGLDCLPSDVYAIELDERRSAAAKSNLPDSTVVGPASFYGVSCPGKTFSLTYVNPPFDDEIGGGDRVEGQFLEHATRLLMPKGIMALVCPEDVSDLRATRQFFMSYYDDVSVVPFPDAHRKYNEVVILGVKRSAATNWYDRGSFSDFYIAPKTYLIPPSIGPGPSRFLKTQMTDKELAEAFDDSPLMKMLKPPPERRLPSPPLQLGIGHLAMLLSAGQLDGLVQPNGQPPHVVRGTARKVEEVKSTGSEVNDDGSVTTKTVLAERITLTVRAVDQTGCIKTFAQE